MPRRLGQHFLTSRPILQRIAEAVCPDPDWTVIEIGPGRGALTDPLLTRAHQLIAIEVDQVLVHYLQQKFRNEPKFSVLNQDVLKSDLTEWGQVAVVGNLPYYITSPIVEKVLAMGTLLQNAVFLVQKEVAERMAASPGSRDYGYLSVQVRLYAEPKVLFSVPRGAFSPPPKVDSAVIQLKPRPQPLVEDPLALLQLASHAFRQKRKTLRNNLAGPYLKEAVEAQPEARQRAEQLSIEQFADLHQRILKFR